MYTDPYMLIFDYNSDARCQMTNTAMIGGVNSLTLHVSFSCERPIQGAAEVFPQH